MRERDAGGAGSDRDLDSAYRCVATSVLPSELKNAVLSRLREQGDSVFVARPWTKEDLLRLNKPGIFPHEMFTAAERTLQALRNSDAPCSVWEASDRYGVLTRCPSSLAKELGEKKLSLSRPRGVFDIQNLNVTMAHVAEELLDGFDIFDEGALLSLGSTFTSFHVEDYCLQTMSTLQRVHSRAADACKIWFVTTDPVKGQNMRRAQYHCLCLSVIECADYILVQQEGQTIYIPPLAYHAVQTVYSETVVTEERFSLLCGTLFADLRKESLWRGNVSLWMRNHQTGHRHGSTKCLLKKYVKYVEDPVISKRPSKKQKRKEKAASASATRWNKIK